MKVIPDKRLFWFLKNDTELDILIFRKKLLTACLFVLFTNLFFANLSNAEENAAELYTKAGSMLTKLPEDFPNRVDILIKEGWSEVDSKEFGEIIAKNQEAIIYFKKATKIKNCDFTFGEHIKKTVTSSMPQHLIGIMGLTRLIILEGKLYEKANKLDLALENYLYVLKSANHLGQQNDQSLLNKAMEIIVQRSVYVPLEQYVNREDINIQNCQTLLDNLISLRNEKIGLEKVFEEEKEMLKNYMRMLGEEAKERKQYDENFYQRFYQEFDKLEDEYFGYLIAYFKENKPEKCKEKFKQLEDELEKQTQSLTLAWEVLKHKMGFSNFPLLLAKRIVLAGSGYSDLITKYHVSLTELDILITAAAIKVYQLKNSKIPENLQELVPSYLTKLPEDPFNDFKPLRYERINKGWIVYSFGPDKQDDHGSIVYNEGETKDNKGDIVFSAF